MHTVVRHALGSHIRSRHLIRSLSCGSTGPPRQVDNRSRGSGAPIQVDLLVQAPKSAAHPDGAFKAAAAIYNCLVDDVDLALPASVVKRMTNLEPLPLKKTVEYTTFAQKLLMTQYHPPILVQCPLWPAGSEKSGSVVAIREAMMTVYSFDDR